MDKTNPTETEASSNTFKAAPDCIYERLRSEVCRIGSASGPTSHIFFVFGASVCFILFK